MSSWKNDMMEVKHIHSIFSPLCLGNNCKMPKKNESNWYKKLVGKV